MLALLLIGLFQADAEPPQQAKGPPPTLAQGKFENKQFTVEETRPVTVTRIVQVTEKVNGQDVVKAVPVAETRLVVEKRVYDLSKATLRTVSGKRLAADDKNLPRGLTTVVLSSDGNAVDPAFLRVFKGETIVVAAPPLGPVAPIRLPK